ncbi:hypothetical protein PV11_04607 [Exophiala sideris]|uniref:DNA-directed RNA polymerase III subunit RPC6 n=1 Tax=Exophiala sideris TaxID=1016849 RepID=A0A0D1Z6P6_9EURO|nr:hypothetical protein PV11_04607 [Exophiala sideris]
MAPPKINASPAPGPSGRGDRNRIAEALYDWCRNNHDYGHVFLQNELLDADIVPNRDVQILLSAVQYLVQGQRFRLHDTNGGTIGWELVDPDIAKNYTGLTRDELMVIYAIEAAGSAGIWTKTIKFKSSLAPGLLDRVYKKLETKGLIKPMKHVKNPGRKMYILAGLDPSEEATGGAWFSEGHLDVGLVDTISNLVEHFVSTRSWQVVEEEDDDDDDEDDAPRSPTQKRKAPSSGFEDRSDQKAKAAKTLDGHHKAKAPKQTKFQPFPTDYRGYPTVREVTRHITNTGVTVTGMPQNAISQLLDVMVYDDRLFKMHRDPTGDEFPDDPSTNTITMFRSFKTPLALKEQHMLEKRMASTTHESVRKAAYRQQELEEIGYGGSSEVPCMRCPVFEICGDGGPVNVVTCKYWDEWYLKIAELQKPSSKDKPKSKSKDHHFGLQGNDPSMTNREAARIEIDLDPEGP